FTLRSPTPPPRLPLFPTRRSSDLPLRLLSRARDRHPGHPVLHAAGDEAEQLFDLARVSAYDRDGRCDRADDDRPRRLQLELLRRSEEHTSELQSRSDLVCRLLLEK